MSCTRWIQYEYVAICDICVPEFVACCDCQRAYRKGHRPAEHIGQVAAEEYSYYDTRLQYDATFTPGSRGFDMAAYNRDRYLHQTPDYDIAARNRDRTTYRNYY